MTAGHGLRWGGAASAVLLVLVASGCTTMGQRDIPPDQVFGSRVEGRDDEGRETLMIEPPDTESTWSTYPATFESVIVRPEPFAEGQTDVAVEILVKGAFPDACTVLHAVEQQRYANLVEVTLQMRRPQGAMCAAVLRPYRFYLVLEGRYAPGAYGLKLNDRSFPFELRAPEPG